MNTRISLALQSIIDPALADYGDRILWLEKHVGHNLDGMEIGLFHEHIDSVMPAVLRPKALAALGRMKTVSLHLAKRTPRLDMEALKRCLDLGRQLLLACPLHRLSFHLDMEPCFHLLHTNVLPGVARLVENPDATAQPGFTWQEMAAFLDSHKGFQLLFDMAHAGENDRDHCRPEDFIRQMGGTIGQIHFSYPANLYDAVVTEPEFTTSHSMASLLPPSAARNYAATILDAPCRELTIEGVLPPGDVGRDLLLLEIALLRSLDSHPTA